MFKGREGRKDCIHQAHRSYHQDGLKEVEFTEDNDDRMVLRLDFCAVLVGSPVSLQVSVCL